MKYRNMKVVNLLSGDREREERLQPDDAGFRSAKGLYISIATKHISS